MPVSCCAPGCTQRFVKGSGVRFFRFPQGERRKRWQIAMRRMDIADPKSFWEPSEYDRLCSLHFVTGSPSMEPHHPDYVPSQFNFTPTPKLTDTPARMQRYERSMKRRKLAMTPNDNENLPPAMASDEAAEILLSIGKPTHKEIGTDPEPDPLQKAYDTLKADHTKMSMEYQRLLNENRELKSKIEKQKFTYTNVQNSEVGMLTGLPSMALFVFVLDLVKTLFKPIGKLRVGDMLLLVLMKLRLNLTNAFLAKTFQICPTQVSKILTQCLPLLSKKLKPLITWPSKDRILKNMPKSFRKHYKKCRVIIDCTEIFIQRPTNLKARAKTWSNYKHHNTMKVLIGITPYGAVSFVSKCWGGRVSDKVITNESDFYNKLDYGDLVLADRGFLIQDELAAHGAQLAIPPFTKGKKQLSQKEVECSRRLSRSRIHVERAIERVKRFHILKGVMPISLLSHANSIVTICAALTNLLPKLVK